MNKTNWPQNKIDMCFNNISYSGNEQDCWEWIGKKDKDGYGIFIINNITKVHRAVYEFYNGQFPKNLMVCHKCDNPSCCNPDHLFLGTAKDNKQDAVNKKRHAFGSKIGISKLTEKDVETILIKLSNNEYKTYSDIIKNHPYITRRIIYNLLSKNCWQHMTENIDITVLDEFRKTLRNNIHETTVRVGENNNFASTNDNIIKQILDGISSRTYTSIEQTSHLFDISIEVIMNILNNKSWKHISKDYDLPKLKRVFLKNKQLTIDDVKDIKIRLSNGETAYSISKTCNCGMSNIYAIQNGKIWAHVII